MKAFNQGLKYHNKPTIIDGIRFASKKEAQRYCELKVLEKQGEIKDLKLQPRFKMAPGFTYISDFSYHSNGKLIVEDVKGVMTQVFILKKKCFTYFYPEYELRIMR